MSNESQSDRVRRFEESVEHLRHARTFPGEPAEFWREYLDAAVGILNAAVGLVAIRRSVQPGGEQPAAWRPIAFSPPALATTPAAKLLTDRLDEAGALCGAGAHASLDAGNGDRAVAVRIDTGSPEELCVAAFLLHGADEKQALERLERLLLVADTPRLYQLSRVASESRTHVEHFSGVLDLMVLVNAEKRFMAAAMVFCNELASRHNCERVSLGWHEKGYVRVKAMSHVENFERKMEAVQRLEMVMEEAFDQDQEIVMPAVTGANAVARDHEAFLKDMGGKFMCSLPLREDAEPVAVCTCERSTAAFTEREIRLLRLSCDHVVRRLADLKRHDRWFGARLMMWLREKIAVVAGPEHTWAKVITVGVAVLLGILCFARIPYRVEAPFILRTDDIAYLTAPFDGHIDAVAVRVGDNVRKGQPLLMFDRSDLLLEEAAAVADRNRYDREAEKARARDALADMKIAEALREQADARLALIRHRLALSAIVAPFRGTVIEGDLMERIGAPVRQGDVLFKVAEVSRVYAELDINEKDIHQVPSGTSGKLAFASRPQDSYRMKLIRVEPVAVPKEKGNKFIARCEFEGKPEDWWRPGMTGVAKLNAGWRTPLWILTHRTMDFLRLRLWWW